MSNPFDTTLAKGGFAMRVSVESWHCLISRIALELDHSIDCLSWCMLPLHDSLDGYLVTYSVRFEEEDVDSRNRFKGRHEHCVQAFHGPVEDERRIAASRKTLLRVLAA